MPASTTLTIPNATFLSLSDDGRFMSYTVVNGGTVSLYVRNLQTSGDTLIDTGPYTGPTGEGLYGGALSADGRYIVYAKGLKAAGSDENQNNDSVLLVKDLQAGPGAAAIDVTPPKPAGGDPTFLAEYDVYGISQDGNEILYQEIDDGKTGFPLSGSAAPFVYNRTTGTRTTPDPTGSNIGSTSVDGASITPDGQSVLLNFGNGDNEVVTPPQTLRGEFAGLAGARISDDGRYIALGQQSLSPQMSDFTQIHDITLPNSPDRVVSGQLLALSGNGRVVAVADPVAGPNGQTSYNIDLKAIDTGATTTIGTVTQLEDVTDNPFYLSYDAGVVAYQTGSGIATTTFAPVAVTITAVAGDDFINAQEAKQPSVTVAGKGSDPGDLVTVTSPSGASTSTNVLSDGTWSTMVPVSGLTDGTRTFTATITDNLGRSATISQDVVVDTVPPTLTIKIGNGATINAAQLHAAVISGTSDGIGDRVEVTIDGQSAGTATVQPPQHAGDIGTWSLTYDASHLAEGQHALDVTTADEAGNVRDASTYFEVDTSPPKIAITSVAGDDVVDPSEIQGPVAIVGTSDAIGETVTITADNKVRGTAVVQSDGSWVADVPLAGANGSVVVFAEVPDEAGNIGAATQSATVDTNILRASVASDGAQATGDPDFTFGFLGNSVSADGRYVLFGSDGNTSIAGTPYTTQEMLKDLSTGTLTAVGMGYDGVISRDGHFAAYVGKDGYDVVNLATGTVAVADTTATGAADNGGPYGAGYPAISDDGRYVVFTSTGTNLVPGLPAQTGSDPSDRTFVKDMQTGAVSLVSFAQQDPALHFAQSSGLGGGRYVAFESTIPADSSDTNATPSASDDAHLGTDIFLRDIQTQAVTLVSATPSGNAGNLSSYHPAISPDGRYVAFYSYATNLVAGQTITTPQAYLRDLQTGTTTLLSAAQDGTPVGAYAVQGGPAFVFPADDREVAFYTAAQADPADTNKSIDVYIKNLRTGVLSLASSGGPGPTSGSDAFTFNFDLTSDGHDVTFSTNDPDLVTGDTNGFNDIFIRRLDTSDTLTLNPVAGDNAISSSEESATLPVGGTTTVENGTVSVTVDGTQAATAIVHADGTWSTTIDATVLSAGRHAIAATVRDAAGFPVSAGAIVTVAGSNTVLTAHLVDDTGSSAGDRTSNKPTVIGRGIANAAVSFKVDGVAATTTSTADAAGTYSFTPTGLADGSHTVVATQTDGAGNIDTAALNFTLDTTAPIVAITSPGTSVATANQTIAGTVDIADAGSLVSLYDNGSTTPLGTGIVQANGAWSSFVTLSPGANDLVARVTDAAGNVGTASVDIALDATSPEPPDTLVLQMAEDAYQGDAQFDVTVDGRQVGDPETVTALEGAGQTQSFTLTGAFGAGPHTVGIDFLNDAYGNSPSTDRNLYVKSLTLDGVTTTEDAAQYRQGVASYAVTTAQDTLLLNVSEDAYQGDATFAVTVDGKSVGGPMTVTALHDAGQAQTFALSGTFGTGPHTVGIDFLNDAYGGSPTADRNLYVNAVILDGVTTEEDAAQYSKGVTAYPVRATQPDLLTLKLSEDAYAGDAAFTVAVDGKQIGGPETVTAPHGGGGSQVFTFAGSFTAGPHDVTIDFLNDAWGGTPATDRNLYVDSIGLNGTATAENAAQYTAGNAHYTVSGAATATPGSTPLQIGGGATLILDKSAGASAVQFSGTGSTLELTSAQTFHGAIGGFAGTDVLDLRSIGFGAGTTASLAYSGTTSAGVLSLSDGTHTANLALQGSFSTDLFSLGADAFGGTVVALKHP